ALSERTEGWAAGLQLAGLALQGQPDSAVFISTFAGSHRYVFDYLAEEVLKRQPEEVQRFLMETSILDRLNGQLCEAVMGITGACGGSLSGGQNGQAILQKLERDNL